MMKRIVVVIVILMLTIMPSVLAIDSNVALTEGTTSKGDTAVTLVSGDVTFNASDVAATTSTEIDGTAFTPALTKSVGDELVWGTGEKSWFVFDDPTVSLSYQYSGKQLKETIVLKSDKELSFPLRLGADSKLVPWDNGRWKVVSASSGNTMQGIIIENPFGIDATGKYVEMKYTYDGSNLNLVYNRTTTTLIYVNDSDRIGSFVYSDIAYPLTIDPTWTSSGAGAYSTLDTPGYNVTKWNVSGASSWTVPSGVTNVEVLLTGGGASGAGTQFAGGGGAGGLLYNATFNVTPGAVMPITIGAPGLGSNGGSASGTNTTFGGLDAWGGGRAIVAGAGSNGGSGGGGDGGTNGAAGLGRQYSYLGTVGFANNGGAGDIGNVRSGGGGGANTTGYQGIANNYGGNGGDGRQYSLTGVAVNYSCGGAGSANVANPGGTGGSLSCGGDGGANGAAAAKPNGDEGGSGGGGGYYNAGAKAGGNGGVGILILKFALPTSSPIASFTPTGTQTGIGVATVTYTDTSTGTISDYNWTYQGIAAGNNTVTVFSTAQNPTASFYFGNYSIKHGVNGTAGSNISTQIAWVNVSQFPAPVASFTPVGVTTGISPVSVSFTDTSTNNPTYWNWSMQGYGTNSSTYVNWSTAQNPSATFTTGNFSISLGAGGVGGFNISTQKTWINVSAYPQIVANFSANTTTPVIPGAAVQFTDSSTPVGLGGLSWLWNFGDGSTDTTQNPIHVYTVGGLKTVNLTVFQTLNPSNINISVKTNYINVTYNGTYVQAGFTCSPVSGSSGLLVTCTDTSIRGNTALYGITYNWSFGDAGLSSSPFSSTVGSVTHVYPSVGTFTMILKVNNTINSDTMTRENYITISTAQQNTWYSPKQIALTVMSFTTSDRVVSAPITLQAVGSSLQDIGQLQTIYGVNPTAANQMANGTLIMSSSSGSDGTAMFTVLASIRYIANVTDPNTGITYSVPINPGLDPYNVWIGSNPMNNLTSEQIAMNGTRLFVTQADPGNVTLNLNYQDISGATTDVHFTVVAASNMTTIVDQDLGNPGTGVVVANWTHRNIRGNGYYWYYNATRTV